jgi:hypothetical protein
MTVTPRKAVTAWQAAAETEQHPAAHVFSMRSVFSRADTIYVRT